jgi:hypothetical protein
MRGQQRHPRHGVGQIIRAMNLSPITSSAIGNPTTTIAAGIAHTTAMKPSESPTMVFHREGAAAVILRRV